MAEFDGEMLSQDLNAQLAQENIQLRNSFQTQTKEITYLRNMIQQPARSAPPTQKSLNLPLPPRFSRSSSDLNYFKLRLIQYLGSNMDAYAESHNQILFTGSLMDGPASQWRPQSKHAGTAVAMKWAKIGSRGCIWWFACSPVYAARWLLPRCTSQIQSNAPRTHCQGMRLIHNEPSPLERHWKHKFWQCKSRAHLVRLIRKSLTSHRHL